MKLPFGLLACLSTLIYVACVSGSEQGNNEQLTEELLEAKLSMVKEACNRLEDLTKDQAHQAIHARIPDFDARAKEFESCYTSRMFVLDEQDNMKQQATELLNSIQAFDGELRSLNNGTVGEDIDVIHSAYEFYKKYLQLVTGTLTDGLEKKLEAINSAIEAVMPGFCKNMYTAKESLKVIVCQIETMKPTLQQDEYDIQEVRGIIVELGDDIDRVNNEVTSAISEQWQVLNSLIQNLFAEEVNYDTVQVECAKAITAIPKIPDTASLSKIKRNAEKITEIAKSNAADDIADADLRPTQLGIRNLSNSATNLLTSVQKRQEQLADLKGYMEHIRDFVKYAIEPTSSDIDLGKVCDSLCTVIWQLALDKKAEFDVFSYQQLKRKDRAVVGAINEMKQLCDYPSKIIKIIRVETPSTETLTLLHQNIEEEITKVEALFSGVHTSGGATQFSEEY